MKMNPLSLLAVVALTVVGPWPALAAKPHWGEFKKDNCSAIGKRQYSAILWDISGSWEAACKKTPATINGKRFAGPARCKKTTNMWGEFDLDDPSCIPRWGEFRKDECKGPGLRQYSAILWDIKDRSWEEACSEMPATINGRSFARPTRCWKQEGMGMTFNMWGQFDVPDASCK